ncbi:MAG: futalosine hydrolase [Candidatus Latescibacterota bacterium]|nr:futalosine hydrolase [Candidatus Latescibacterota bacterium]
MTILVLSATRLEQAGLADAMVDFVDDTHQGHRWRFGELDGQRVRLVETGIGLANVASTLTRALELECPAVVLQVGVGGAYPSSGLNVGDLAVASEECYGELGVATPQGWQPADLIGIPVAELPEGPFFNRYPLKTETTAAVTDCLREHTAEAVVRSGLFVTVQECGGTDGLAKMREERFSGALCENMEGAAAAHICALYGAELIEVRAISNRVEDRDLSRWNLPLATAHACAAARALIARLLGETAA